MKEKTIKLSEEIELPASASKVWNLLGDFNSISSWHPVIKSSSLDENGRVRRVKIEDDAENVEKLIEYDKKSRYYTYTILDGPLPVSDYIAKLEVEKITDNSTAVKWSCEFMADGVPDAEVEKNVQKFFQAGLDNLKKIFS